MLVSYRPGTLHDFHSHEIAEQLTLLDAELFYKIEVWRRGWGEGGGRDLNAKALQSLVFPARSPSTPVGWKETAELVSASGCNTDCGRES